MAIWTAQLPPESAYLVDMGGILLFSTDGTGQINWRYENQFNGLDNIVGPNSDGVLVVNAVGRARKITITTVGNCWYTIYNDGDAYLYRVANNLPHGRGYPGYG